MTKRLFCLSLAIAALLLSFSLVDAFAQELTPVPLPTTPEPEACTVQPRTVQELEQLFATPVAVRPTSPAGTSGPFTPPAGKPADPATVVAITATMMEFYACSNAGNPLAVMALQSEEFLQTEFATVAADPWLGPEVVQSALTILIATPAPLPPPRRVALLSVTDVTVLPDGHIAAIVEIVLPPGFGGNRQDYVLFTEQDRRYLIVGGSTGIRGEGIAGLGTPNP